MVHVLHVNSSLQLGLLIGTLHSTVPRDSTLCTNTNQACDCLFYSGTCSFQVLCCNLFCSDFVLCSDLGVPELSYYLFSNMD